MFFLIFNFPFGIGGAAICAGLAAKTGRVAFYSTMGTAIYVSSWAMFGLGALLAGKEGVALSKQLMRKLWRRKKAESDKSSVTSDQSSPGRSQ